MVRILIILGVIFAVISGTCFYVYLKTPPEHWAHDPALNLGTEAAGIFVTLLFIDMVLRIHERKRTERYRALALKQLRTPLKRHFQLLFDFYKASAAGKPEPEPSTLDGLFGDRYFASVAYMDFLSPAPESPPRPWAEYAREKAREFAEALGRTVTTYCQYLDEAALDTIETLRTSGLLSLLEQAPNIKALVQKQGRALTLFCSDDMRAMLRRYVESFCVLVKEYDKTVPAAEMVIVDTRLWRDDLAPSVGSARIQEKDDPE